MAKRIEGAVDTEEDLAYLLEQLSRLSVGYYDSELANQQLKSIQYYKGEAFGNEEDGRSKVVSHDVSTVVDAIMPDLIKVFLSGDNVVEFEAQEEGAEEQARQATDLVNDIFFKDNDGYTVIHDWAKDGLLLRLGIVKAYWNVESRTIKRTFENQPMEALQLMQQDGWEPTEHTENEDGTHDVTVTQDEDISKCVIESVPPEEFFIAPRQKDLQSSEYTASKTLTTVSELITMGFDKKVVMDLGPEGDDTDPSFDERRVERYEDQDYTFDSDETYSTDPTMRKMWLNEEYVRVDYNGDGIAELRKVTRVGTTILENIEVDYHPFVDFTPIKISHTIIGKSVADDVMDVQLVKSTLLRQSLDNLYITNNPRIEVPDAIVNEDTFDDLLTMVPGAPIRTKGMGGLNPIVVPFTARDSFGMLAYWDQERQQRTGVTDFNQGLDTDTLNDRSGRAIELIQNKGMGKIELIARNLGNSMGILFQKILMISTEFQDKPKAVNVRGKWQAIDASKLNPYMKVKVQVGLGTGDKGERIKARMGILQQQKESMQLGLSDLAKIYSNLDGLTRDMDLGDANKYFIEPPEGAKPPQRPDPRVELEKQKMQMKAQADKANYELKAKGQQADMQLKMQGQQADNAIKQQGNMTDVQYKEAQLEQNYQLGLDKIEAEEALKREQMAAEYELKREEMYLEAQLQTQGINASVADTQMGGDIG